MGLVLNKVMAFYLNLYNVERDREIQREGERVGWLRFTSHRQRGHLETAPPFTVPCAGHETRFLNRSHQESNPGPSRGREIEITAGGHHVICCYGQSCESGHQRKHCVTLINQSSFDWLIPLSHLFGVRR